MKPFSFCDHARERAAERRIDAAWVEMVIAEPEVCEQQTGSPQRWRLWRRIAQYGDRVLCVVLDDYGDRFEVVTVFFDRGKRL